MQASGIGLQDSGKKRKSFFCLMLKPVLFFAGFRNPDSRIPLR
jgi:hypothetical protein